MSRAGDLTKKFAKMDLTGKSQNIEEDYSSGTGEIKRRMVV